MEGGGGGRTGGGVGVVRGWVGFRMFKMLGGLTPRSTEVV